tara:strand:+ start:4530 stop:9281 length:4752 start_codon:yes stop_codon:yes gene_type:complete
MNRDNFLKNIRTKYPQYNDIGDDALIELIIKKYPQYKSQVDLKKKDLTSESPSLEGSTELIEEVEEKVKKSPRDIFLDKTFNEIKSNISKRIQNDPEIIDLYNLSIENTKSVADVFVNQYESLSNINVESEDDLFRVSEEINNDFSFIAKKNLADNTRYNQILSKYNQEGIRLFTDAVKNYDETQAKLTRFTDVQKDFSKFGLSGNLFQGEGFFPAMYDAFKYSMPMSQKSYRALSNSKQIKKLNREKRNLLKKDANDVLRRRRKNDFSQFSMGEEITVGERLAEINKAIPALKKEAVINMSEATGISKFLGNLDESTHFVDDVSFMQFKKILGQSLPNMAYAVVQPMIGSAILEGGGLYMDALNEKAIEKFGDDYTQEEMLSLIGSGEDDTETILGASAMMASLDLLGAGKVVNLTSKVIKNIAKDTIKKTGKNIGNKGFVFNTLQNGFKGFATEFITGGGQNVIGQFAIDRITTEDKTIDFSEVFKSAVDEGVGGGGVVVLTGSVGGGLNYTLNKLSKKNLDKMFTINGQDIPRADFIKKLKSVTSLSELKKYNVLNDKRAEEILNKKKSELSETDTPIESAFAGYESAFTKPEDKEGKPKTFKETLKEKTKKIIETGEAIFDRQSNIRRILTNENFINTRAYMTNMAGMMAYGGEVAYKQNKKIFGSIPKKIKKEGTEALNDLIILKRIIQLDSKRDSKNLERIKHPDGYNLESASKKLKEIRKKLGRKNYKDLDARADNYSGVFNKMLEEKYDAGLITEDTYKELKDDFYSPRRFLEKLLDGDDVKFLNSSFNFDKNELNNIRMGADTPLNTDFETLLALAQSTHIKRMHANKMTKSLYQETTNKITDTGQEFSWFKQLKKKPKKKGERFVTEYEPAPNGFTEMSFKQDGKVVKYAIQENLATEFMDKIEINHPITKNLGIVMGANILRAFATGYNPQFAAVNVPMDISNQVFFTDIHDDVNIYFAGLRLLGRSSAMAKDIVLERTENKKFQKFKSKKFNELLESYMKNGGLMSMLAGQTGLDALDTDQRLTTKKESLFNYLKRGLAFTGEVSELSVRLAGFEQARKNIKKNNPELSQEEVDIRAVEKTRQALDFNMGNAFIKMIDQVNPYTNVAFQAARTAGAYIRNNPLNFSKKLFYGNLGLAGAYVYSFLNYDEEDKEDWNKVPDYIKNNNYVVLYPKFMGDSAYETIEKNGVEHKVRKYVKIRLAPQVANFITQPSIAAAESLVYNSNGGKSEPSTFDISATTTSRYRQFLNFSGDILKGFSPVQGIPLPPVARGLVEVNTNYDVFRDRPIETQSDANVSPSRRGIDRKDIPSFYKTFAEVLEKSESAPAEIIKSTGVDSAPKMKHFTESVLTSDRNHFLIGSAYIMGEHINNMIRDVDGSDVSFAYKSKYADKNVLNPFESLFGTQKVISTVPIIDFGDESLNELIEKANYRDGDFRQKLKILIQKNPDIDDSEKKFRQVIDGQNFTEKQKKQALEFYKYNYKSTKIKNPDNIEIGLRIKYEDNAFARSAIFFKYFGKLDKKEKFEILEDFKLMGVPNVVDIAKRNIVLFDEFKDEIEEVRSYEATSILEPLEQ